MDNENSVFHSLEIIENRITEKLNVADIASGVYFSQYHYQRLFREIVGDSVMEYVTKRKLTLAGRALLETNATILDIALKFGFDSHEGFTRSFKAYMGVTPTDYRKYGLTTISQKAVKEKCVMLYSKTTDEIIRELNDFIAKAKETANYARKNEVPEYIPFWNIIADTTDAFTDKVKDVLEHITAIAEHPDEITNQFAIIKVIEDIAFQANLLAFNVNLMVSRGQPEHIRIQKALCEKYVDLAQASVLKTEKITQFFNELSSLIFKDIRTSAEEKLRAIFQKGNAAAESIIGYAYIKDEVVNVVRELSVIQLEEITVSQLEDYLFRLNIISFAADMDVFRSPKDKALFNGLAAFKESLSDAISFFQTLVKPESDPVLERTVPKYLMGIVFQTNVLLFYTRGEISYEKLGHLLDDEQKAAFNEICSKINCLTQFMHKATDESAYIKIADRLYDINSSLIKESDKLKERGGAVRFIASEFKGLADSVMRFVEES
jgi:AraC-like DNA-binding protein